VPIRRVRHTPSHYVINKNVPALVRTLGFVARWKESKWWHEQEIAKSKKFAKKGAIRIADVNKCYIRRWENARGEKNRRLYWHLPKGSYARPFARVESCVHFLEGSPSLSSFSFPFRFSFSLWILRSADTDDAFYGQRLPRTKILPLYWVVGHL
jgi:hypothetical protein